MIRAKGGFFQKVRFVFQISQSPKKIIPKNYPELEIWISCLLICAGISNFKLRIAFLNNFLGRLEDLKNESHFLKKRHLYLTFLKHSDDFFFWIQPPLVNGSIYTILRFISRHLQWYRALNLFDFEFTIWYKELVYSFIYLFSVFPRLNLSIHVLSCLSFHIIRQNFQFSLLWSMDSFTSVCGSFPNTFNFPWSA